jgi:amidase
MNFDEYRELDAVALASLVCTGEVHPREIVNTALAAVLRLNPHLNAVLQTFDDEFAIANASGPLYGVPFLIKDLVSHRAGGLLEMGSRLARGFVTPHDTELMHRFRRAGLITIGRTATPEFGHGCTTEPVLTGPTRNPWDLSRMAGGSSGGSASAVAAGIVPAAHASDGAGSIRIPSACCGVFGLKPSRARVSLGPDTGESLFGMGIENVLSRTVRDSAAILDCIEGPAAGDPYQITRPQIPYREAANRPPAALKIAFTTTAWSGAPVDEECVRATRDVAKLCAQLGHVVEEASPSFEYDVFRKACIRGWAVAMVAGIDRLVAVTKRQPCADYLETATLSAYELGRCLSVPEVLEIPALLNQICRSVAPFFESYDMLLTPTTSRPAAPLGTYNQNRPGQTTEQWFDHKGSFAPFLALFNVTGQPAMSVPLSTSAAGLPIGAHFAARFGQEGALLSLATQLESERPWISRRPPFA